MEQVNRRLEEQQEAMRTMEDTLKAQVTSTVQNLKTTLQDTLQLFSTKLDATINNANPSNAAPNQEQAATYAQMVATQITQPQHKPWIQKGKMTERQLIVRKPRDGNGSDNGEHLQQWQTLNEEQLVQKAAMTIDLMHLAAADKPKNLRFIGARKLAGGDVILDLNDNKSARWLRQADVLKSFNDFFGGTTTVAPRTFPIILQFVPIFAEVTNEAELRQIEAINELPQNSLRDGRWLKNPANRKNNQTYAHAQVGCTDINIANKLIRDGITIHGKHIAGKKPALDIPRCTKCQQRTWHKAQDCKAAHDTCARCAEDHKTEHCTVSSTTLFKCAICQLSGHGAASNECPRYQEKLSKLKEKVTTHKYIYYPADQPWTWITINEPPRICYR